MRYVLFALVLGMTGCATSNPGQTAGMECWYVGPPLYTACGPAGNGAPVGPSSQEHRYDEARH